MLGLTVAESASFIYAQAKTSSQQNQKMEPNFSNIIGVVGGVVGICAGLAAILSYLQSRRIHQQKQFVEKLKSALMDKDIKERIIVELKTDLDVWLAEQIGKYLSSSSSRLDSIQETKEILEVITPFLKSNRGNKD